MGSRGGGCAQDRPPSRGGPARASRPGAFPARLGAGLRLAGLAAGTEPGRVRTPANRKRKREARRGGPAGPWGVPGVGAGIWGTPAGASRLGCMRLGVGGHWPPLPPQSLGLNLLCKVGLLLRAGARADGGGGEACREDREAQAPRTRGREAEALAHRPCGRRRGSGGAGPGRGGAGTWVRFAAPPLCTSVSGGTGAGGGRAGTRRAPPAPPSAPRPRRCFPSGPVRVAVPRLPSARTPRSRAGSRTPGPATPGARPCAWR